MSVRREITEYDGIYFITITCSRWLHLFDLANGYDEVYKWFDYLKKQRSKYYSTGEQGIHVATNYAELEDIDLTKAI